MKALLCSLALFAALTHARAEGSLWSTDLEAAKAKARAEKKLVLIDFTGSDWCPPCKKLNAEVLSQKEFLDYAQKHFVLVEVDSPRTKPQSPELKAANAKIKSAFAIRGFPTLLVLTPDGKELWRKVGYGTGGIPSVVSALDAARKKS